MIDPNDFSALTSALRQHPKCAALIVWQDSDTGDLDPETVDWGAVEDRGVEAGHDVIAMTGDPKEDVG